MKILSEMPTGLGSKWVLVKYENDFYAYGMEKDLHSLFGFPVNQCGTKEEVIKHCNSIAELCRKNIKKYQKEFSKDNHKGWNILIEQNQKELEILIKFKSILESC